MNTALDPELKAAAAEIFTEDELVALFSHDTYKPRPAPEKKDARSFAERLQADREAEDRARYLETCAREAEVRKPNPALLAALNAIGTDDEMPLNAFLRAQSHSSYARELSMAQAAYAERASHDRIREADGRVWDLLPPGTSPRRGDEIEDEGVWRPRPVLADYKVRYDRALFARTEAQRLHDASPTEETRRNLEAAIQRQSEALRAADTETVQVRDRIDIWRAGEGREIYNASRRQKRQTANMDLSAMSDEEKAAHKREQARLRKQKSRAQAKALI